MHRPLSQFTARRSTGYVLCVLALMNVTTEVAAQDRAVLVGEPDDEVRIRRWLEIRAERGDRRLAASFALGNGILAAGVGAGLRLRFDTAEATWGSVALLAVGVVSLAQGIILLATPNRARQDLEGLPERTLTEREIGRYEAVLRDAARGGRARRRRALIGGGALVLAPIVCIPIVATSEVGSSDGRSVGYGVMGAALVAGLIYMASGLFEGSVEADWREYRRGLMPQRSTSRVQFEGLGIRF